jgi:mxaJ protein
MIRSKIILRLLVSAGVILGAVTLAHSGTLRVCADPNNLPFSNSSGQGFENRLVQLVAQRLGDSVEYTWWAQRRGYVRHTIKAGSCDVWPGVATGVEMLATTQPYYRSTYVFVSRVDRKLNISSLDDPRLRHLEIGVQMVGDDANNTPPAHALARRGIIQNVHGYMLYGDYNGAEPQRAIVDAVEDGKLDIAIVWGPIAGYFSARESRPLSLIAVHPQNDEGIWPMTFTISMGIKRGDPRLKKQLNEALQQQSSAIAALLNAYHVPRAPITMGDVRTAEFIGSTLGTNKASDNVPPISFEH